MTLVSEYLPPPPTLNKLESENERERERDREGEREREREMSFAGNFLAHTFKCMEHKTRSLVANHLW